MSTGRCPRGFRGHTPTCGPHHTSWLSLLMFCFISSASITRAGPPVSVPAGEGTDGGGMPCQAPRATALALPGSCWQYLRWGSPWPRSAVGPC